MEFCELRNNGVLRSCALLLHVVCDLLDPVPEPPRLCWMRGMSPQPAGDVAAQRVHEADELRIHIPYRPGADEEFDRQPLSILYDHLSQFKFIQRDNATPLVELGQFD